MPRKKTSAKKPLPPFYRGIKPLIDVGLIENMADPFAKLLWDCEKFYLDAQVLKAALIKAGIDAEEVLAMRNRPLLTTPGSPGHHRKVFDKRYLQLARALQARIALLKFQKTPPKDSD